MSDLAERLHGGASRRRRRSCSRDSRAPLRRRTSPSLPRDRHPDPPAPAPAPVLPDTSPARPVDAPWTFELSIYSDDAAADNFLRWAAAYDINPSSCPQLTIRSLNDWCLWGSLRRVVFWGSPLRSWLLSLGSLRAFTRRLCTTSCVQPWLVAFSPWHGSLIPTIWQVFHSCLLLLQCLTRTLLWNKCGSMHSWLPPLIDLPGGTGQHPRIPFCETMTLMMKTWTSSTWPLSSSGLHTSFFPLIGSPPARCCPSCKLCFRKPVSLAGTRITLLLLILLWSLGCRCGLGMGNPHLRVRLWSSSGGRPTSWTRLGFSA